MLKELKNTITVFILASFFLHAAFWSGLHFLKRFSWSNTKTPTKVEIVAIDHAQYEKMRQQQIVEQDNPINDEIPEDSKYMSAHNQRVVKETRAKNTGEFRNSFGTGITQAKEQNPEVQKSKSRNKKNNGTLPTLSDLRPKFNFSDNSNKNKNQGSGGPASQTNDYIKDADPSLQTLLNTREFIYYTYYQRIRTQIRQFWEPSIRAKVKKLFAQGRTIASERDHVTRLVIFLDKNGALLRVQVIGESGVRDLDEAAIEAFRAAEPFPNPPKGIIEGDGTIKINWDFILEA